MRSRLTLPLLVILTIAGYGYRIQGSVPDVPTGQWMPGAALAQPREGAVSAVLDDGRVLIIGGRTPSGPVATVEAVNADGSIAVLPPMTTPRAGHTAVVLADGSVLIAGGTTLVATDQGTLEAPTASAEIFTPGPDAWAAIFPLTVARTGHTATALADGRVVVAGGTGEQGPLDSIEVFEPVQGTFRAAGLLSAARIEAAAAVAGQSQVLVVGGRNADGVLATADLVDVDSGSLAQIALTSPRAGASVTRLLDGSALVAGGSNGTDDLASAEVIDPIAGLSSAVGSMARPRTGHQAALLDRNANVLILGGTNIDGVVARLEHFIPWTGQFVPYNAPDIARLNAVVSNTSTEGVAVLGAGKAHDGSLVAPTAFYGFATLKTDKPDYQPGQFVTITGSGWQPGETVTLILHETGPGAEPDVPLIATADAGGRIFNDWFAPNDGDLGRRFYLTAVGVASTAQTTFTDSRAINSVTLNGGTSVTVLPGASITAAVNATTDNSGGNNDWESTSWRIATTPPGTTTCVNTGDHTSSGTFTESFSITAPNAAGIYNAYFIAHTGNSCTTSQQSDPFTVINGVTVKPNTTTTITSDTPDPSVVGQAVTINYSVAVVAPGTGTPAGNVTVSDGTQSCTGTVAAGSCSISFTTAGAKSLTATYAGSSTFNGSGSAAVPHTVNTADTTTTITNDTPDPSVVGQPVAVSYTVTSTGGTPTGNVTVSSGSDSCTGTVAAGTCTLAFTSAGAKSITAIYAGDVNFSGSTSASAPHQVNPANTTTTISADTPDPSVVGQPVAVSYTVAPVSPGAGTPTGTVTVSDGTSSCSASVATGTCSITFTTAGNKLLTATYGGDGNFNGSASTPPTAHTVNKADTATTITSDAPDPSVVGQAVTINYSVAVQAPGAGVPTGSVTVSAGSDSCTGTVAAGNCSITLTSAGAKSLTATYGGDTDFNTSMSASESHQVDKANTTTTISSETPDPSVVGQPVTVNFSVTVTAPGSGTPTGTVTVSSGSDSCTATVAAGSCSITFTTAGAHPLVAGYGGDTNFNGSTSAAEPHTVDKAATTITITSDLPDPSVVGQSVPVNFSVTVNAPGSGTPTGNVTVSDGTDNSCTAAAAAGTCSISFASAGSKSLTATYAGDTNYDGSTSPAEPHTVDKANTTTTITGDAPDPSVVGQPVTVNFSVTVNTPGSGTPIGNVTVSDGTDNCTGTVTAGSCVITFTSAGVKSLTANYVGNSNFNASTSAAESHQVDKANTTTTITGDTPDPSVVGQPVTVNFSVTVDAPGSGTPTGSVMVSAGTDSCTGTVAAGSCAITFTSAGAKSLTASYVGDSSFNGSTSAAESHQVDKANTTTAITGDTPDPSVVGQAVTVNFSVTVDAPGSGAPTGSVTVSTGTTSCTATVSAGGCSLTLNTAGSHPLTATYAGDSNFNGSVSATEPHQVEKAQTTTAIVSDTPDPSVVGQPVPIAFTVTVNAPGAGTPTGNVTVSNGAQSCVASVATGSCSIAFATAGPHPVTATYAGDANFDGSASAVEPHQVDKADTTATITSDIPDPSVVGEGVVVNYTVAIQSPGAGTPTGNVTVSAGADSCTGTAAAGACTITFTSAGARSLTATYSGDANFNGSTSAAEAHHVDKANTTATIVSDLPDPSVVGQPVAVQFSVAVAAPGAGTPTGLVTVSDGTISCSATVAAGQCNLTFATAGPRSLVATYAGDTNFNGSTSPSESHQVDKASTSTAITSDSPDPSVVGQSVIVAFSVTVNAPGNGTPAGNVTVSDGTISCTATVAAGSCSLTFANAGARSLTATYAGDGNFDGSASGTEAHQVDKAATTTTTTSDAPDPSVAGESVTVAFTVAVDAPGVGTPTGNVTVSDGTVSCSASVAAGQCSLTFPTAGTKSLTATYSGDTNFSGSTSAAEPHQVSQAATTTTITADTPDPSVAGQSVTISYAVTVNAPGSGTPTGNVTVSDGTQSCTGTVAAGSCTIAFSAAGAKSLTATFGGDANFSTSTSIAAPHQVDKANTTTSVVSDTPDPSVAGQAVTVTYSVVVDAPGSGAPTGNVTVSDGTTSCTGTVAAGSCSLSFPTAGPHPVTAVYAGDSDFNGSTSAAAAHGVNKAGTTTTILSDTPDPSLVNAPYTVTWSTVVDAPGSGTPTGNVTISDGTASCSASVSTGSCSLSSTTAGTKTLVATYAGDTNFNGSVSAGVSHGVTYTFAGFFSPVDTLPVINSAKAGSAIPTKWRLTDASGTGISNTSSFVSFTSYNVACGAWSTAITDPVPEDYSGNSGLQYLGNGNWQFNWKTPKDYAGQCRVARVTLNDGSIHEYYVKFK